MALLKKKNVMQCINSEDSQNKPLPTKLWGPDENSNHRNFDIVFKPCDPIEMTDENKHLIDKQCITNFTDTNGTHSIAAKLKNAIEYVKTPELLMITNDERPDYRFFGD